MNPSLWGMPRGLFQELRLWLVPIGVGMEWWGPESSIPSSFVASYGQSYPASTYPRLAKAWGITGQTITMPDKRGRMSIGKDDMGGTAANRVTTGASGIDGATLGASGGAETVVLAAANNASHRHRGARSNPTSKGASPLITNSTWAGITAGTVANAGYVDTDSTGTPLIENQGSGTAHQNMPPGIVCNYIIKVG